MNFNEPPIDSQELLEKTCNVDSCTAHVMSLRDLTFGKIYNFESWKSITTYDIYGRRLGGRICSYLPRYGYWIIVPVMMNFVFHLAVILCDLRTGKSGRKEIFFALILCYPQWRLVKILTGYFFHKDEEKLNNQKIIYERDIETAEAYLEATIQVHIFGLCNIS